MLPDAMVLEAIAEQENVQPADLPPFGEWVSEATLDTLSGSWDEIDSKLKFTYVWYHVTVHPTEEVSLHL